LTQIVNKHHEIVVTREIDQRYQSLFDILKKESRQGPGALNVVRLYYTAKQMRVVNNARSASDVPSLPDESHIKDEDRDFARLANLVRAVLVTYDGPLIRELATKGVLAVTPDDASELADP
jgi:Trm5-related predicted tRNA methylase